MYIISYTHTYTHYIYIYRYTLYIYIYIRTLYIYIYIHNVYIYIHIQYIYTHYIYTLYIYTIYIYTYTIYIHIYTVYTIDILYIYVYLYLNRYYISLFVPTVISIYPCWASHVRGPCRRAAVPPLQANLPRLWRERWRARVMNIRTWYLGVSDPS